MATNHPFSHFLRGFGILLFLLQIKDGQGLIPTTTTTTTTTMTTSILSFQRFRSSSSSSSSSSFSRIYLLPFETTESTEIWSDASSSSSSSKEDEPIFSCALNFDNIYEPYISPLDSESTFLTYTEDGLVVPAGPLGQFKERLANALSEPIVELTIALSVILSSLLVALGTLDGLDPYRDLLKDGEIFVSIVFGLDFFGRWFSSSKEPGKHVFDIQFALDVVVVILPLIVSLTPTTTMGWDDSLMMPKALTSPSGLINLELLRVLRLRRVLKDLASFERFAERVVLIGSRRPLGTNPNTSTTTTTVKTLVQEWQLQLARVLLSLFTLVSVASGLVYTAENGVNPDINNYFDALYFGLTTLTTVGFGDITPITVTGKLVVCGSILVGVAVVPAQAAALVEALLEREELKRRSMRGGGRRRRSSPRPASSSSSSSSFSFFTGGKSSSSSEKQVFTINMEQVCSNCGATFHWAGAEYCYSCGELLD